MTDTERLAALLHEHACMAIGYDCTAEDLRHAARLIAAGVRVGDVLGVERVAAFLHDEYGCRITCRGGRLADDRHPSHNEAYRGQAERLVAATRVGIDPDRLARAIFRAYHGEHAPKPGSVSASLDWGFEWYGAPNDMAAAAVIRRTMPFTESLRKLLPNMPLTWEGIDARIAAIETEARAALLAELEAGVEGLPWDPDRSGRVSRAAVLDLIRKAGKPDAPDVWDDGLPPGGWVCGECGQPVESEPCAEHQPRKASAP